MAYQLKHTGYIIPEIYQEPYKQKPFPVTLRATSIGNLKNIKYLDANQDFITGTATLMEVITTCLNKLDYQIDIWDSVNTWEENMDVNVSPLTQAEIDQEAFIVEKDGRLQAKSCYEVLEQVLKPFVVNFFMDAGHWVIVPIELRGKSRTVRVFDYTGTLQSSSMKDPTETFDRTPVDGNYCWVFSDQTLTNRPLLRDVQITHEHGLLGNILPGGNFNSFDDLVDTDIPTGWTTDDNANWDLELPIVSIFSVRASGTDGPFGYGIGNDFSNRDGNYIHYVGTKDLEFDDDGNIKIELNYVPYTAPLTDNIMDIPFMVKIGTYYLQVDGTWTTSENIITISDKAQDTLPWDDSNVNSGFRTFEILADKPPEVGSLEARLYAPEDTEGGVNVATAVYSAFKINYWPNGLEEEEETVFFSERDIEVYSDEVNYDLISADGPTNIHESSFLLSSGLSTRTWMRNDLDGSLIVIAIQQIFREYSNVTQVITGSQRSSKLFDRYFTEYDHTYTVNSGSYDERMCFFNGELMEVLDGDISVTVYKVEQDGTLTQVDPIYS